MTTRRVVDVIAKAEFKPWDFHPDDPYEQGFRPITQMSMSDRKAMRQQAQERKRMQQMRVSDRAAATQWYQAEVKAKNPAAESWNPNKPYAPTHRVYSDFAYTSREGGWPHHIGDELKESTTPSAVHRNIHYGVSVPEQHRAGLDARIDPKLVGRLRHPVVIHHAPDLESNISGAAMGAHITSGNKGHIALRAVTPAEHRANKDAGTASLRRVLNHELAHASTRGINPKMTWSRTKRFGGEEGRADTVSGANVYIKNKSVSPNPPKRKVPISGMFQTDNEFHYHRVRSAIKAARRIVKSEYAPGRYKPVTQMNAVEQLGVYHTATGNRIMRRHVGKPVMPARWDTRDKTRVYEDYGYFKRSDPKRAVKEMAEPSTPSAVHPNVHYGASIPAEHHARLDRKIDPKLSAALKHPVVIHHEPYLKVGEAALGAHVTTGNKGHVVLSGLTRRPGDAGMRRIINHELVHASTSGTNPVMTAARTGRQMGEEARADAISGANLYRKLVPETATHYHKVHALIRAARKVRP